MNVDRLSTPRGLRWHWPTVSPLQPAQKSIASRYVRVRVATRSGVPVFASGAISVCSSASEPKNCPEETTWLRAPAPGSVASRSQTENSSSGACGANACQAAIASAASSHGHSTEYVATLDTGWTRNVKRVATPKFPPPPPRQAQKRSAWCAESHVNTRESAV